MRLDTRAPPSRRSLDQAKHFRDRKSTILRALGQSSFVNSSEFALLWIKPDGESECYASEAFQPRLNSWFPQPLLREAKEVAQRAKRELEHRRGWVAEDEEEEDCDDDWQDGNDDDLGMFAGVDPFAANAATAQRPAMINRSSSISHSLAVPSRPSSSQSVSSISPLSTFPSLALAPSPTIRPTMVANTFTPSQLAAWFELRFNDLMGKTGRIVAKQWIKAVEPQKQTLYPYIRGEDAKPSWWPLNVRHKEPDHLVGSERTMLLVRLLEIGNIPELELATAGVMHSVPPDKMSLLRDIYQVAKEERRAKEANGGQLPDSITVMLAAQAKTPNVRGGGDDTPPKKRGRRASTLTSANAAAPSVRASPYPPQHRRAQSMVEGTESAPPLVRRPSLIRSVGSSGTARSRTSLESAIEAEQEREEFQEEVGKAKKEHAQRRQQRDSADELKPQIGLQAPITLHAGRRLSTSPHAAPRAGSTRPEMDRRQSAPQPRRQSMVQSISHQADNSVASPSMIRSRSRLVGIAEQGAFGAGLVDNRRQSIAQDVRASAQRAQAPPRLHVQTQPNQQQQHQMQHHHPVAHYQEQQPLSRSSSIYDEFNHSPSYAHLDTAQYLSPALEPSPTLHLSGESSMQLAQQQYLQAAPSHVQPQQANGQQFQRGHEVYQHSPLPREQQVQQPEQHQYANYAYQQPPTPTFPLSSDSTPSLTYSAHSSASQDSQWANSSMGGSSHSLAAPSQFVYDNSQQFNNAHEQQPVYSQQYEQVGVYDPAQDVGQWDQQAYAGGEAVSWDSRAAVVKQEAFASQSQSLYSNH